MEKVKLDREAAEALELMKAKGAPLNEIVERHVCSDLIIVNGWENVRLLPTDTLIRALYIGYEVEQTPEDKVRELYREWADKQAKSYREREPDTHKSTSMFIRGMMATLEALGITIDQVNDIIPIEGENT